MTDHDHDVTPVATQAIRGQVVYGGIAILADAAAGEFEARPVQREPKGWSEHFRKQVE